MSVSRRKPASSVSNEGEQAEPKGVFYSVASSVVSAVGVLRMLTSRRQQREQSKSDEALFDYILGFPEPSDSPLGAGRVGTNTAAVGPTTIAAGGLPTARGEIASELRRRIARVGDSAGAREVPKATQRQPREAASVVARPPPGDDTHTDASPPYDLLQVTLAALQQSDAAGEVHCIDSTGFPWRLVGIRFSEARLQLEAETTQTPLVTSAGICVPFQRRLAAHFPTGKRGSVFTPAERVRLTNSILGDIHLTVPGGGEFKGVPITHSITELLALGILTGFPLHDQTALDWFNKHWIQRVDATLAQPLDKIASYFGESVAFYFAWLQFYTVSLIVPAGLGALLFWYQLATGRIDSVPTLIFALLMAVWGTLVMKVWKRRQSSLAYDWGVLGFSEMEEVRVQHRGDLISNPLTGKKERAEKMWKQQARFLCVSVPCIGVMIFLSCLYLGACERLQVNLKAELKLHPEATDVNTWSALVSVGELLFDAFSFRWIFDSEAAWKGIPSTLGETAPGWLRSLLGILPTLLFGIGVPVLDMGNGRIVALLNDFENHRTDEEHVNALIGKQALLQLITNFTSLIYIAFFEQDLDELRERLIFLLFWKALINNAQELALPLLKSEAMLIKAKVKGQMSPHHDTPVNADAASSASAADQSQASEASAHSSSKGNGTAAVLAATATAGENLNRPQVECCLEKYDPFSDILEMFIQFGHVTLFAAVFPLAPLLALFNNVLEVHSDSFKLCSMQRPTPQKVASLGSWVAAFEFVSYMAVATNVALVGISVYKGGSIGSSLGLTGFMILCVALEHILIIVKVLMDTRVPDVPEAIRVKAVMENRVRVLLLGHTQPNTVKTQGTTATHAPDSNGDFKTQLTGEASKASSPSITAEAIVVAGSGPSGVGSPGLNDECDPLTASIRTASMRSLSLIRNEAAAATTAIVSSEDIA